MGQLFAVILIFFLSLVISANALEQPDINAIKSLKKMETKAQMGASYNDYTNELADTKSKVDIFMQSPEAKNELNLVGAMKKAIEHYDFAKLVWERARNRKKMESESYPEKYARIWNPIKKRKARIESLKELEEDNRLRLMGKSTYYLDKVKDSDILQSMSARYLNKFIITKDEIYIDELLPIIWQRASNEFNNAAVAFHKQNQAVEETNVENIIENSLVTENMPVHRPRRWRKPKKSEVIKPPPAPLTVQEESHEPLPVSGSVMRMINPAIHDQD